MCSSYIASRSFGLGWPTLPSRPSLKTLSEPKTISLASANLSLSSSMVAAPSLSLRPASLICIATRSRAGSISRFSSGYPHPPSEVSVRMYSSSAAERWSTGRSLSASSSGLHISAISISCSWSDLDHLMYDHSESGSFSSPLGFGAGDLALLAFLSASFSLSEVLPCSLLFASRMLPRCSSGLTGSSLNVASTASESTFSTVRLCKSV